MNGHNLERASIPGSPSLSHVQKKGRHGDSPRVPQPFDGGLDTWVGHDVADDGRGGLPDVLGGGSVHSPHFEGGDLLHVQLDGEEDRSTGSQSRAEHGDGSIHLASRPPAELTNGRTEASRATDWTLVAVRGEHSFVAGLADGVADAVPAVARERVDYGALSPPGIEWLVAHGAIVAILIIAV